MFHAGAEDFLVPGNCGVEVMDRDGHVINFDK
jgi:hypothetical protein